jgi:Tfp pilus assembly protein PilF
VTPAVARRAGETALAVAVAAAALAYDPAAPAARTKALALLLCGLGAMGVTASRVAGRESRRRWLLGAAARGWLGCVGWWALSTLWAARPVGPELGAWVGASAVMLAASTLELERTRRAARITASLVGVGSAAACLAEAAMGGRGMALHGLQGNPNWLGLVLACTVPLQLESAVDAWRGASRRGAARPRPLREPRRLAVVPAGIGLGLTAVALGLSRSRVAWVALAACAVCGAASLAHERLGGPARRKARALGVALGLCAALALGGWLAAPGSGPGAAAVTGLDGELASSHDGRDAATTGAAVSWAGRRWIWRIGASVALDALPFGAGLGDVHGRWLAAQGRALAPLPPREAAARFVNATTVHQDWIESAASGGVGALTLLGLCFGLGLWTLGRSWPAGAASVLCVGVCALGDSPLEQPALVAVLALVWAGAPRARLGRAFMAAWAGVLAAVVLLLPRALASSVAARLVARADAAEPAERLGLLQAAVRTDPRSAEAELRLGLAQLELGTPAPARGHLERARELAASVGAEVALGNAELALGRPGEASACYRRALGLDPGSFRAHANLAEALRQAGLLDEAESELRAARSLQPGHPKLAEIAERVRLSRIEQATAE